MTTDAPPSIRHLHVFMNVAELQSIRRAAEAVFLSQPALTQAIARIEKQVSATLFVRRSTGTYLTPEGKILVARTAMMFEQIHNALVEFGLSETSGPGLTAVAHRITRQQIRVLMAITRQSSFADAARYLGISQSSLHRAARDLEGNLGRPLFQNGFFGVVATSAAGQLARKLSLAVREIDWGLEEIRHHEGKADGELRIGAGAMAGSFLLGQVLPSVTKRFPNLHVHVRTGDGASLSKMLLMGEIDFILGLNRNDINTAEVSQEALFASPYVLVARRGHPLSNLAKVTALDLEPYDWVAPTHGAKRRAAFDALFSSMSPRRHSNIEAYSLTIIRALISESDRVTLLTRFEYEHEAAFSALAMMPIEIDLPIDWIGVAQRSAWTPTPLQTEFLSILRRRTNEIATEHKLAA